MSKPLFSREERLSAGWADVTSTSGVREVLEAAVTGCIQQSVVADAGADDGAKRSRSISSDTVPALASFTVVLSITRL